MDLSNMIINSPAPPDQKRIKPQVSDTYRNPPANPDQEKIKPIIVEKDKTDSLDSDELDFAAILKELCEQGIFDCEEEYRFSDLTSSSSGEEGEIKDSSPDDTMYNVVVKKEPVDKSETNQGKDLGKRLMLMDIRGGKKESTTHDRKSIRKKHSKHKKKHSRRRDDYDSDESDYSRRHSKSKRVQGTVRNDSRSDNSDGSVEFICSRRKEDKIIFENLTSSSDESQSKEKEHHKKQKQTVQEHVSDKDRHYSRPAPVPPSNSKEDKIKETRRETSKKNEKSTEEKSKEEKLREEKLREEKLREEKEKLREEKLREEKLREKKLKEEKLKEEKSKDEKFKEEYIKEEKKFKFKEEQGYFKEEYGSIQHIHGSYSCELCHVTMNSEQAYHNHMRGKKHLKTLKLKNAPLVVASTITPAATEGNSKYPIAHPGYTREKVNEEASVQAQLERINNRKMPFPGLENVTEIHLEHEKKYYCALCDAVCSPDTIVPHLQGYKHRLKLLKKFRPELAERWSYKAKTEIDDEVCNILYAIQKKRGLGKMSVEKDRRNSNADLRYFDSQPSTSYCMPSTSRKPALKFEEYYEMASQPDPTKPGYYCNICFSHMNSRPMWESHIRGKRHLTNLKKQPGDLPSKAKTLPAANVQSRLLILLEEIEYDIHHEEDLEPIVGLENIQETQTRETNSEMYQCFLCGACLTSLDIYDHLISYKHRLKYLEHIDFPDKELLVGIGDSMARTIMKEMCKTIEENKGRGSPIVHVTKSNL